MKLFVGSLPYELTDENLKEIFEAIGLVNSAKIIIDRQTNRSRGFGFVEMAEYEDGKQAIEQLNGTKIKGRSIVVKKAHNKERERTAY